MKTINLDDDFERAMFLREHGTLRGRTLANRLSMTGSGSIRKAEALMNYAWNREAAHATRRQGDIVHALEYEDICERIYEKLPDDIRW
jgi:hypothetical protein